jgi:hypothetical protein
MTVISSIIDVSLDSFDAMIAFPVPAQTRWGLGTSAILEQINKFRYFQKTKSFGPSIAFLL